MAGSMTVRQVASGLKCLESFSSSSRGALSSTATHSSARISRGGGLTGAAVPSSIDTGGRAGLRTESNPYSSSSRDLKLNNRRTTMGAFIRGETCVSRKKKGLICSALAPATTEETRQNENEWDFPKMKELMALKRKI